MGGFDDHVAIMGDWISPISSPRAFFSSVFDIEAMARSIPESDSDNRSWTPFSGPEMQVATRNTNLKDKTLNSVVADEMSKSDALSEPKTISHGSLMERMIARAGFNAPRLNTENIRLADLPQNPEVRSPYLTIPPGLSPTTLLDSPLFVSDSQVSLEIKKSFLTPDGLFRRVDFIVLDCTREEKKLKSCLSQCRVLRTKHTLRFPFKASVTSEYP
ncbi:putative WRKY transcription factor 2 [Abeliophyllum distichum]|uniref:WRKY transcription factor 2 n=1 Tax=Abeliophyllum distichum TaxID=126358 RepID=A0ABD1QI81_9LAMI